MKKWIAPLLSLLVIVVLLLISSPFSTFKPSMTKKESKEELGILLIQDEEKKEQTDPHLILVLKRLREKLDEWLKSLNGRIESEDISRLEVRFLEILRNILEWVREKVDAKIESFEKEKPQKKEGGLFRETHQRVFPFFEVG
jgi:vacuolar-type H+-ATPase subunit I/STV1